MGVLAYLEFKIVDLVCNQNWNELSSKPHTRNRKLVGSATVGNNSTVYDCIAISFWVQISKEYNYHRFAKQKKLPDTIVVPYLKNWSKQAGNGLNSKLTRRPLPRKVNISTKEKLIICFFWHTKHASQFILKYWI